MVLSLLTLCIAILAVVVVVSQDTQSGEECLDSSINLLDESCLTVNVTDAPTFFSALNTASILDPANSSSSSVNLTKHLVLRITVSMNYEEYVRDITLRRPDVASVIIQCANDILEWRCGGGYCLTVHHDTKTITIVGCRMFGGIQAIDPNHATSSMSLIIQDGLIDGTHKTRPVSAEGLRNVMIQNMTLRNGKATLGDNGGCLLVTNGHGYVIIVDTFVHSCTSYSRGGCVAIRGNTSLPDDSTFTVNETTIVTINRTVIQNCVVQMGKGGALFVDGVHTLLLNDFFAGHSASLFSGGCLATIDLTWGTRAYNVTLKNCSTTQLDEQGGCWTLLIRHFVLENALFDNCTAGADGGAMRLGGATATLTSVRMFNCHTKTGFGGALYAWHQITVVGKNLHIVNTSAFFGGAMFFRTISIRMENVIVENSYTQQSPGACSHVYDTADLVLSNISLSNCRALNGGSNPSALYAEAFGPLQQSLTLSHLVIQGADAGCIKVVNYSLRLNHSSMRDCGFRGPVVGYVGSSIRMQDVVLQGYDPPLSTPPCLDVRLSPEGNSSYTGVKLLGSCDRQSTPKVSSPKSLFASGGSATAMQVGMNTAIQVQALVAIPFGTVAIPNAIRNGELTASCNGYVPSAMTKYISSLSSINHKRMVDVLVLLILVAIAIFLDITVTAWRAWSCRKSIFSAEIMCSSIGPGITVRTIILTMCSAVASASHMITETTPTAMDDDDDALAWTPTTSVTRVLGWATMVGYVLAGVWIVHEVCWRSKTDLLTFITVPQTSRNSSLIMFTGGYWENASKAHMYNEKYGHLLLFYTDRRKWFVGCDTAMTYVVGMLAGVQTSDITMCVGVCCGVLVLYGSYVGALVWYKPFHTPRDYVVTLCSLMITICGLGIRILDLVSIVENSQDLVLYLLGLSTLVLVIGATWTTALIIQHEHQFQKNPAPIQDTTKAHSETLEPTNAETELEVKSQHQPEGELASALLVKR
eukprot:PhF_6_TR14963/c0_g1_i1/m.23487